jgi:glycogen(starch) synthase
MVERVLTDPELADRLVAEGSEHILRFDWTEVAESTAAVYSELAGVPRAA